MLTASTRPSQVFTPTVLLAFVTKIRSNESSWSVLERSWSMAPLERILGHNSTGPPDNLREARIRSPTAASTMLPWRSRDPIDRPRCAERVDPLPSRPAEVEGGAASRGGL